MSRRNTDAITIHSILDWIEDNLESPLSLEKVSERSGYSKWHLQRMFKKETGHSLGQYIRSRKLTEIAQKLKESNEPILYLAERYGFSVYDAMIVAAALIAGCTTLWTEDMHAGLLVEGQLRLVNPFA